MMKHAAFSAKSCVLCVNVTVRSPFRSNYVFTVSNILLVLDKFHYTQLTSGGRGERSDFPPWPVFFGRSHVGR